MTCHPDIQLLTLLINAAATLLLTGVIWLVQIVHYPLFSSLDRDTFTAHHRFHSDAVAPIVAPLMVVELLTSIYLVYSFHSSSRFAAAVIGLLLVIVIWLSTFLLQVRFHKRLAKGFDADAHRLLVRTNWIRTAAWSARSLLALAMLDCSLADRL